MQRRAQGFAMGQVMSQSSASGQGEGGKSTRAMSVEPSHKITVLRAFRSALTGQAT